MTEEGTLTQSLIIQTIGRQTNVPGNMISKYLFRYHCVRRTTLGSEILNICIYKFIQKSIKYQESYDFMMHNFGFILLIVFVATKDNIIFYYVLLILYLLHIINMIVASMFFGFPISRAKDFALLLPTKNDDSIIGSINKFIEVKTFSEITYSISDDQVAVLAKASSSGTIKFMVYNQSYSTEFNYSIGYLNCWIQVVMAIFVLGVGNFEPFTILICYPLWWGAMKIARKSIPGICECFLFPFYCSCYICLISSRYIKEQFESRKVLEESLDLNYITGIKNSRYW